MRVYIKRRKDFSLAAAADCDVWELPLEAVSNETGSAELTRCGDGDYTGDWLYVLGRLALISQASPDRQRLKINTVDPINAFDRKCWWPDDAPNSYGAFIQLALERDYRDCADSVYRLPYLHVTNSDYTPLELPELDDTRLYTLDSIMATARQRGVLIQFALGKTQHAADTLEVHISTAPTSARKIVMADGHHELVSETYSPNAWSRITVMQEQEPAEDAPQDQPTQYVQRDYYLTESGHIALQPPGKRAEGKWEVVTANSDESPLRVAAALFADNLKSHKIEFKSDRLYTLYQHVLLRLPQRVLATQIVYVGASSRDQRYAYKCGQLAVTLTDKMRSKNASGGQISGIIDQQEQAAIIELQPDGHALITNGALIGDANYYFDEAGHLIYEVFRAEEEPT